MIAFILAFILLTGQASPQVGSKPQVSDMHIVASKLFQLIGSGKGEFETTAEFNKRVVSALATVGARHLFPVHSTTSYDADTSNVVFEVGMFAVNVFASCRDIKPDTFQDLLIGYTAPVKRKPIGRLTQVTSRAASQLDRNPM